MSFTRTTHTWLANWKLSDLFRFNRVFGYSQNTHLIPSLFYPRWAHLQGRCLLKRRRGRMNLLRRGDWACGKPEVTERWRKSAQLKRRKKRRTPLGWCALPLLLASHLHSTTKTRKRSAGYCSIVDSKECPEFTKFSLCAQFVDAHIDIS